MREHFNRLRKLTAWQQEGPALDEKLDEIESIVSELRKLNKGKKTRQKKGGLDRQESGGEDR